MQALGSCEYFDVVLFGILESREDALEIVLEKLANPSFVQKKQLISLVRAIVRRSTEDAETFGTAPPSEGLLSRTFTLVENQWHTADEETRQAIVETLFMLNGEKTLVVLDLLMNDPDPWLRVRVIELLATHEDERLPEFIARYITDEDEMVRQTVEWILESKGFQLNDNTAI